MVNGYWKWVLSVINRIAWGILKAIALIPEGLILAARGIKAQLTWENVGATSLTILICGFIAWLITFLAELNAPFPADVIRLRMKIQIAWAACFLLLTYAYYKDEVEEK